MAARKQNIILKSLLHKETNAGRSSLPQWPSQVVEKPRLENDAWCIIATDGSKSIISCKSALNKAKPNVRNPSTTEDLEKKLNTPNECPPDPLEHGVDLSCLNVENETVSKLIAGMKAMTVDEAATSSEREIEMPSAKTDLKEIFKSDNICMVSLPKTAAKGGFGVQGSGFSHVSSSES
jgi:hypothetical protein